MPTCPMYLRTSGFERISPAPNTMKATPLSRNRVSRSVAESEWLLLSATAISLYFQISFSTPCCPFSQNLVDHGGNHFYRFLHSRLDRFAQSHVSFFAS